MVTEPSPGQELALENCRILVVDDNEDIHDDFRKILAAGNGAAELERWEEELFGQTIRPAQRISCEIDTATQGQTGFEMACTAKKRGEPYAVAIIDMRMPPGWDGLETARRIALEDSEIQLVICTAYSDYSASEITDVFGNSDRLLILKKPFDAMEVQFLVTALVAKWNQARESAMRFRALERSEEEYRVLTEHDPDTIMGLDPTGRVLLVNRAPIGMDVAPVGSSVFEYSAKLFPENRDEFARVFRESVETRSVVNREWRFDLPGGPTWIAFRMIPIVQEGEVDSVKLIVSDISERKETEDALREAGERMRQIQKMESLGSLAGGIAHDFNNLLAVILGYAEMATTESDPVAIQDDLEQIRVAGARAKDLVQKILVFSQRGAQQREVVEVKAIVDEAADFLRASLPSTIEIDTSHLDCDCGCRVYLDPTHLHQVVMNLCVNAGQAMESGPGLLCIATEKVWLDDIPEGAALPILPGEYVRLRVADTGCGMDAKLLDRIFEPFFSTKHSKGAAGTGMGLAAVHGIVGTYDGTIAVSSELGGGTTFDVYLPLAGGEVELVAPPAPEQLDTFDARIMVVDDEPLTIELLKQMLERLGCEVECVVDSVEALMRFRKDPHAFDLVLTDHAMPRMTGDMLSRELVKIRPELPVLLCSGYSEKILGIRMEEAPIRAFLRKPISLTDLSKALAGCLKEGDAEGDAG